jgi:uncharacterized surface protein with fasciclin (FAS1) repeats
MRWIARSLMALLLGAVLVACAQPGALTISQIAAGDDALGTFSRALDAADLTGTFGDASAGPFTVFAPNDAAFAAFAADQNLTVDELLASDALEGILQYHVVEGIYTSANLLAAIAAGGGTAQLTTLEGSDLSIALDGTAIVIDGTARRVGVDLPASNGVIHVINGVLTPAPNAVP